MSDTNSEDNIGSNQQHNGEKPRLLCYFCNAFPMGFVIGDLTRHLIRAHNLVQDGKKNAAELCPGGCGKWFVKKDVPTGWPQCYKHASPQKKANWQTWPDNLVKEVLVFGKKATQKKLQEVLQPGSIEQEKKEKRKQRDIKNREAKKNGEAPPPRAKRSRQDDVEAGPSTRRQHHVDLTGDNHVNQVAWMPPNGITAGETNMQQMPAFSNTPMASYGYGNGWMPPNGITAGETNMQQMSAISNTPIASYAYGNAFMPPNGITAGETDMQQMPAFSATSMASYADVNAYMPTNGTIAGGTDMQQMPASSAAPMANYADRNTHVPTSGTTSTGMIPAQSAPFSAIIPTGCTNLDAVSCSDYSNVEERLKRMTDKEINEELNAALAQYERDNPTRHAALAGPTNQDGAMLTTTSADEEHNHNLDLEMMPDPQNFHTDAYMNEYPLPMWDPALDMAQNEWTG